MILNLDSRTRLVPRLARAAFMLAGLTAVSQGAAGQIVLYVNAASPTGGDGTSWATALGGAQALQNALAAAAAIPEGVRDVEIWVARGAYVPVSASSSFQLQNKTRVFGGFAGNETARGQRNWFTNPTVLSGDRLGDDLPLGQPSRNRADNAGIVVYASARDNSALLDGFTITAATTDAGRPGHGMLIDQGSATIANCRIEDNDNIGVRVRRTAGTPQTPARIVNCQILGNRGPGLRTESTVPAMTQVLGCYIAGNVNSALNARGGGLLATGPNSLEVRNCTVGFNTATDPNAQSTALGGGMYAQDLASVAIDNSIFLGNMTDSGAASDRDLVLNGGIGSARLWNCVHESPIGGSFAPSVDRRNAVQAAAILAHPPDAGADSLWGTADDGFGAPDLGIDAANCIDRGDNALLDPQVATDVNGRVRAWDGDGDGAFVVDIGAAEFGAPGVFSRLHVTPTGSGDHTGTSWSNALPSLREALNFAAASQGAVTEIWIAAGTFTPTTYAGPASRSASFQLQNNLAIYGGFAGTETSLAQRTPATIAAHPTILSGDLNGDDVGDINNDENSYHVVAADGVGPSAVLDGVVVERGHANGTAGVDPNVGGGFICRPGGDGPTLRGCTLRLNQAIAGGGMYCWASTHPRFIGCTFLRNTAVEPTQIGGGAAVIAGTALFQNCQFQRNRSESLSEGGGAIFVAQVAGAGVDLVGCDFVANTIATGSSGTAAVQCPFGTFVRATNCRFLGNRGGFAAGISLGSSGNATITGCLFAGNSSLNQSGFAMANGATAVITNTTFVGNETQNPSPDSFAAFGMGNSTASLVNCILWANRAGGAGGIGGQLYQPNLPDLRYCTVEGGSAMPGAGNNGLDPLFLRLPSPGLDNAWGTPDDDYGDLRVAANSPAIDSGDSFAVPADTFDIDNDGNTTEALPLDLAGNPRFYDDPNRANTGNGDPPVDRGCYESDLSSSDWINPLGGRFNDPANWSAGVPTPATRAFFDDSAGGVNRAFTVTFPSNQSVYSLHVLANDVTFNLRSVPGTGSLSVVGPGSDPDNPALLIGQAPGLPVRLGVINTGATPQAVTTTSGVLAGGLNSIGQLDVVGQRAAFNASESLDVGRVGSGTLTIDARGQADIRSLRVGTTFGAIGSVTVSDAGNSGSILLYGDGAGGELVVGDAGAGSLAVTGNSLLGSGFADEVVLGREATGSGSVSLFGPGTTWATAQDRFILAQAGHASLSVTGGAQLFTSTASQITLAELAGSHADVLIGSGSAWSEDVQSVVVAGEGTATLTLEPGSALYFQANLVNNPAGTITGSGTITGGVFNVGTVIAGDHRPGAGLGTLTINGNYRQLGVLPGGTADTGSLRVRVGLDAQGHPASDRLAVVGTMQLGGGLIVDRLGNFNPADLGATGLPVISSTGTPTGQFDVAFLPGRADNRFYKLQYNGPRAGGNVAVNIADLSGAISFGDPAISGVPGTPTAARLEDLDGDNFPDLAITVSNGPDAPGTLYLLKNLGNADGQWQGFALFPAYPQGIAVGKLPSGVTIADLDGQPGNDLAVSNYNDDSVSLINNTGGGTFAAPISLTAGSHPSGITSLRADADDKPDLAVTHDNDAVGDGALTIFHNNGGNSYTITANRGTQGQPRDPEPDSPDGDKDGTDVAVANFGSASVTIFRNRGGTFSTSITLPSGPGSRELVFRDLNRDGFKDLAVVNDGDGSVSVILGRPVVNPTTPADYVPAVNLPVSSGARSITALDADLDGDLDLALIVGSGINTSALVLRNDLDPLTNQLQFAPVDTPNYGTNPLFIRAADVDLDGLHRTDVVTINGPGGGLGPRTPDNVRSRLSHASPPCPADFNGDGFLDFFDSDAFIACFEGTECPPGRDADFNADGFVDFFDADAFVDAFEAGC